MFIIKYYRQRENYSTNHVVQYHMVVRCKACVERASPIDFALYKINTIIIIIIIIIITMIIQSYPHRENYTTSHVVQYHMVVRCKACEE